ncbi:MAG: histidine kinase [Agriterribacter sp.]
MKKTQLFHLLLLLPLLNCLFSYGQTAAQQQNDIPVFKQISHPFMPTITSEYFYFTEDGLMWFSTARGLTSFDGSEVVHYSGAEQAYTLGLNKITAVIEDKKNNLYIGTQNGVIFFNRLKQEFQPLQYMFEDSTKLNNFGINSLHIRSGELLYIGLNNKGMLIYDMASQHMEHIDFSSFIPQDCNCKSKQQLNSVLSFADSQVDSSLLWVGTFNGIYRFNTATKKIYTDFHVTNPAVNKPNKLMVTYDIKKMKIEGDTIIWFSTSVNGFGRYHISTGKAIMFLNNARLKTPEVWKAYSINQFAVWHGDDYILGITSPHPGLFNTHTGTVQLFSVINNTGVLDEIQFISNDRKGNVWLLNHGTLYASLPQHYIIQAVNIEKQTTQDYLPNQLGDIFFDKEDSLYYASVVFSSGVHVLDAHFNPVKIIPAPLYTNRYTYHETSNEYITKDGSGRYWTTCLETYILEKGKKTFVYADKVSPSLRWLNTLPETMDIVSTKDGDILLRIIDGTVFRINHTSFNTDTVRIPDYIALPEYTVTTKVICYDSLRNMVYLNNGKYIVQYDFDTRSMKQLLPSVILGSAEFPAQDIEYALDSKGRIWVWIPKSGIRIINPDKLICEDSIINGTRGFISGNFDLLRYGGKGYMVFMGPKGTVIYNYEAQQSLLFEHLNNISSGLFPYYIGHCNNHIVINERNFIRYYNLDNFSKVDFSIHPSINTITSDTAVVYTRGGGQNSIQLSHQQNNLAFSFSAQEFFYPERIQYAYQLTGIDKVWQYTNALNRKINYTRLPPGKYIFKLKAQMEGGNWQGEEVAYTIQIVPAFWQTKWFLLLCISAGVAAIIMLARWRISSIRKKEQQKTMYEKELVELEAKALRMQMNPHFIFNSLNSIKAMINKNENEKAAGYLTTFSKLIRTLFQHSDKREVNLHEELETCMLYTQLEKMRFGEKVAFVFDIDEGLDLKDIKVPALILQPFIENAIWHGLVPKENGGSVLIAVRRNDGATECTIDDDGIGRALSNQKKINYDTTHQSRGISLTQMRLDLDKLLNEREDSITIIDKVNDKNYSTGTRVIITFKDHLT